MPSRHRLKGHSVPEDDDNEYHNVLVILMVATIMAMPFVLIWDSFRPMMTRIHRIFG